MIRRTAAVWIILTVLSLGMTVSHFYASRAQVVNADSMKNRLATFTGLCFGVDNYIAAVKPAWRSRIGSMGAAAGWMNVINPGHKDISFEYFAQGLAWFNVFWFVGCLVLLMLFVEKPLLWMFGMFAAMQYAWTPINAGYLYPWDGPSLFFWTVIILLSNERFKNILPIVILTALLFKETVIIAALIPLFYKTMSIKDRWSRVAIVGIACLVLRFTLNHIFNANPFDVGQVANAGTHQIAALVSLRWLATPVLNTPWLACCGVILALFFVPNKMCRMLGGAFMLTTLVFGSVNETRALNDMIPVFFYGLCNSKLVI